MVVPNFNPKIDNCHVGQGGTRGNLGRGIDLTMHHPQKNVDLSEAQWGRHDYSWLVSNDRTKPKDVLAILQNVLATWSSLRKFIHPALPTNWSQKLDTPLWVAHAAHIKNNQADCRQVLQHKLRDGGVEKMGDILNRDGGFKDILGRVATIVQSAELQECIQKTGCES